MAGIANIITVVGRIDRLLSEGRVMLPPEHTASAIGGCHARALRVGLNNYGAAQLYHQLMRITPLSSAKTQIVPLRQLSSLNKRTSVALGLEWL